MNVFLRLLIRSDNTILINRWYPHIRIAHIAIFRGIAYFWMSMSDTKQANMQGVSCWWFGACELVSVWCHTLYCLGSAFYDALTKTYNQLLVFFVIIIITTTTTLIIIHHHHHHHHHLRRRRRSRRRCRRRRIYDMLQCAFCAEFPGYCIQKCVMGPVPYYAYVIIYIQLCMRILVYFVCNIIFLLTVFYTKPC